jgi:hypothetical protein
VGCLPTGRLGRQPTSTGSARLRSRGRGRGAERQATTGWCRGRRTRTDGRRGGQQEAGDRHGPGAEAVDELADDQAGGQRADALGEGMPRFGFRNGAEDLPAWGKDMYESARTFFDALPNPLNRFVLTTEEEGAELHTVRGNSSLLHQIEFDWLDEVMAT